MNCRINSKNFTLIKSKAESSFEKWFTSEFSVATEHCVLSKELKR